MLINEVVICGCPRTGTTALCSLLNSCGDAFVFNELNCYSTDKAAFYTRLEKIREVPDFYNFNASRDIVIPQGLTVQPYEIPRLIAREKQLSVVGDKVPGYVLLPEVRRIIRNKPNIKFIFTIRDYRAVIASSLRAYLQGKREYWTFDRIEQAAFMWFKHTRSIFSAVDFINPSNFIVVRYESSVTQQEALMNRLRAFFQANLLPCNPVESIYVPTNVNSWRNELGSYMSQIPKYVVEYGRLLGYE